LAIRLGGPGDVSGSLRFWEFALAKAGVSGGAAFSTILSKGPRARAKPRIRQLPGHLADFEDFAEGGLGKAL
jgi:hypothetical protein